MDIHEHAASSAASMGTRNETPGHYLPEHGIMVSPGAHHFHQNRMFFHMEGSSGDARIYKEEDERSWMPGHLRKWGHLPENKVLE
jgi:hypothetical protein